MDAAQVRDPRADPLEQFDRDLDGFLSFVEARRAPSPWSTRAGEPRRKLVERRRQGRVDELVALAAALEGAPRETVRTPLLVAAIHGWLGFTEARSSRASSSDREIGRTSTSCCAPPCSRVLESPHVRAG